MTGFILLAALMALVAASLVAWPLLRHAAPSRALALTLMVLVPLLAGLYYTVAAGEFWRQGGREAAAAVSPHRTDAQAMVASLEARLREAPDDPAGWIMLGRSYLVLQDAARSVAAYERAVQLTGERNVDALIGLGEALLSADETEIEGRAGQLFERSLELAPDDARALWYAGFASYRRGDLAVTRARWQRLSAQELPPDVRTALDRAIANLNPVAQPGPAAEPVSATGDASLRVRVDLAPGLATSVPRDATLFVVIRDAERGPPLAVLRQPLGELPAEFALTQANVMLPGRSLAGFTGGKVVARVSRSGEPGASSGDLFGEARVASVVRSPISVLIDSRVP